MAIAVALNLIKSLLGVVPIAIGRNTLSVERESGFENTEILTPPTSTAFTLCSPFTIGKIMSQDVFTEISDRICKHMNDDHSDAVVLYAKAFGNCPEASAAKMLSIDAQGMNLDVETHGTSQPIRIPFDRDLKDAEDAHHILIDLMKEARKQLG